MIVSTKCLGRLFSLSILALFIVGCGGGGGSNSGGFTNSETRLRIEVTAGTTRLPLNINGIGPSRGGPFTTAITVEATIDSRPVDNLTNVQYDIVGGHGSAFLFCLLNDPDCIDEDENQIAFQSFPFESSSGRAVMFLHSSNEPGTVVVRVTVQDPVSGQTQTDQVEVIVSGGSDTQLPASVFFLPSSDGPLYATGQGQNDFRMIEIRVLDDGGQEIPNPSANNLRVELLPNRPNGGERLVTLDASGNVQEGTVVNTATLNGVAQVTFHAGSLPGIARISATVDRADNNVDNGIGFPVTDVTTVTIGSTEVRTLTFTGTFPGAVEARANALALGPGDGFFANVGNGVYSRLITILAADQFGNPPPPGTEITFFLGDDPLSGYPDTGHGDFVLSGSDGNIEEDNVSFTTPDTGSDFRGARVGCLLFFNDERTGRDGRPDREGVRIITGVSPGGHALTVSPPFNASADQGFVDTYRITCPPTRGNVEITPTINGITQIQVQTDESGVASTLLNYPVTDLGRSFCLGAQSNGGLAGAVLCHWYLGVADGSFISVNGDTNPFETLQEQFPPAGIQPVVTFSAMVGGAASQAIELQLFDGQNGVIDAGGSNGISSPLPGEPIAVDILIVDPDATDAINARNDADLAAVAAMSACDSAAAFAQGVFNSNFQNPDFGTVVDSVTGLVSCILPVPTILVPDPNAEEGSNAMIEVPLCSTDEAPPECEVLDALSQSATTAVTEAAAALTAAEVAEARDALFNPTASFSPDTIITGAQGIANVTLSVNDLPPNGQVTFFVTTVGPEIRAPTRSIMFLPTQGDDGMDSL